MVLLMILHGYIHIYIYIHRYHACFFQFFVDIYLYLEHRIGDLPSKELMTPMLSGRGPL